MYNNKLKTEDSKVSTFYLGEGAAVFHVRAVQDDEKLDGGQKFLGLGLQESRLRWGWCV